MEADWALLQNGLDTNNVRRGVSGAFEVPPGSSPYIYGFNSMSNTQGVVALHRTNLSNFAPFANPAAGGRVSAAMKRATSAATVGFAPFVFLCAASPNVASVAYMLGLADGDPSHVVLRKGALSGGLPDVAVSQSGVLARSTLSFNPDTWAHLRLEAAKNTNGDLVLNCSYNDLTVEGASVDTPEWIPIPGMGQVIDDVLQIVTGTAPLSGGYAGFGFWSNGVSRRAYIDYVRVERQTVV